MLEKTSLDTGFLEWVGDRVVLEPSSNYESKNLPFQSWKPFKEAFAPEIVYRAIKETPRDVKNLCDPFGGSGTSALTSQFVGVIPTTMEVNPFLADLIEAKLTTYDVNVLIEDYSLISEMLERVVRGRPSEITGCPPTFVEPGVKGRYIFSKDVAKNLARLLKVIGLCQSENSKRLYRMLTATVALEVSNITISGKGRRYRKNWMSKMSPPEAVFERFHEKASSAIYDICSHNDRACSKYKLIRGDSRKAKIQAESQDVVVFSPPYPNSFDYTDVYNVELWLLGHLTSAEDNKALRKSTLRSHVQVKRNYSQTLGSSQTLKASYALLDNDRKNLWSKDLPDMVLSYFEDMTKIMRKMSVSLKSKGRVYCVVGDSQYAGHPVPVADILTELSDEFDLKHLYSEKFRSMRASPQQGGRAELPETMLVFEKTT